MENTLKPETGGKGRGKSEQADRERGGMGERRRGDEDEGVEAEEEDNGDGNGNAIGDKVYDTGLGEASQCIWLARVRPEDCEGIVKQTVLKGKVIKPKRQLRGGYDREKGLVSW